MKLMTNSHLFSPHPVSKGISSKDKRSKLFFCEVRKYDGYNVNLEMIKRFWFESLPNFLSYWQSFFNEHQEKSAK